MSTPSITITIHDRFLKVMDRIDHAARQAGRDPADVSLVVVTKTQPVEIIRAVVEAGGRVIGENYPEEAAPKIEMLAKMQALPAEYAQPAELGVEWHMIGHIQSRKARMVCEYFQYVHSLDSLKLAQKLDNGMAGLFETVHPGKKMPVLLECNVSGEESKFGFPAWNEAAWSDLLPELDAITRMLHLEVRGLMTVPPLSEDAQAARPYFRKLRRLSDFLQGQLPQGSWSELSMGMSADFEVAIQEGSTWVRIGQAITGPRG